MENAELQIEWEPKCAGNVLLSGLKACWLSLPTTRAAARASTSISRTTPSFSAGTQHLQPSTPSLSVGEHTPATLLSQQRTARASARASLHFGLSPQHPLYPLPHNTLFASLPTIGPMATHGTCLGTCLPPLRSLATTPSVSAATQHPLRFSPN